MGKTLKKEKRKNLKRRTNKRNTFQKKNEKKSRKITNKRTNKKNIKRNKTNKRTNKKIKRKQSGGGSGNIVTILEIMLSRPTIANLPTSQIFEYKNLTKYLKMVDFETLKDIVLENDYLRKSPTIQKIFNYTPEELKEPEKVGFNVENINCQDLINVRNEYLNKLFLYLVECNLKDESDTKKESSEPVKNPEADLELGELGETELGEELGETGLGEELDLGLEQTGGAEKITNNYVKNNIDWFRVCTGLDEYDATFEYNVLKELAEMGIYIKKSDIIENLKKLESNIDFRLIIKKRLFDCAKNPRTFFDRLFGSISFPSFEACESNKGKGVLYLYDEYRRFLNSETDDDKMKKVDKVKVLIYCETRQHLLSKYISLEMVRLNDKNYSDVRSILNKIYNLDKEIITENDKKIKELKERTDEDKNLENDLVNIENKMGAPQPVDETAEQQAELEAAEQKKNEENEKIQANREEYERLANENKEPEPVGGGEVEQLQTTEASEGQEQPLEQEQVAQQPEDETLEQPVEQGDQPQGEQPEDQPQGDQPQGEQPEDQPQGEKPEDQPQGEQPDDEKEDQEETGDQASERVEDLEERSGDNFLGARPNLGMSEDEDISLEDNLKIDRQIKELDVDTEMGDSAPQTGEPSESQLRNNIEKGIKDGKSKSEMYNTIQKCRAAQDETNESNVLTKANYEMMEDCEDLDINITQKRIK